MKMRAAALYDIHANFPALEAVLEDLRRAEVELVIVGGDVVPGPMPCETLNCLLDLPIRVEFIQGNGEIDVLAEMSGRGAARVPGQYRAIMQWVAGQLDHEHQQALLSWPKTVRLEIAGLGEVLFCHATPRSDNEIFTRSTPEARLLPLFEQPDVPVVVCGHTHMQFDRMIGTTRVINAGSVGMPFGRSGADWLLLGPDVQLRHTPYDLEKAAERIRDTDYPQAQEFAEKHILDPPSEQEMIEVFSRAELK